MSFMLRRIYDGFLYKPENIHIHPLIGILILFLQFGFMVLNLNWILTLLLLFIIFESFLFKNVRGSLSILWALTPILIPLAGLIYLFGGWIQMYRVVIRFLIGGIGFSFFFTVTNPSDLTRVLEKIYIPTKIAIIPSLALTMIPRIARDAEDTLSTLRLRGELKGFFLRWLPKVLAIFIASILYRSEFLAQSLYFKGMGIQKRTHYRNVKLSSRDLIRSIFWILFIICFIILFIYSKKYSSLLPSFFF